MSVKLNLKKDELIAIVEEMGLTVPDKAKVVDLKALVESSDVYKNDIEFVRNLIDNILEEKRERLEGFERGKIGIGKGQARVAKVTILASKSRVAPIRVISIPRLELCACVLLAQLVQKIRSSLRLEISNIVLHTDSTIALAWLKTPANHLKTFIANHVSKVQRLTENCCWTHVSSHLNPADLVSRGLSPRDLPELKLWWNGPSFLEQGEMSSGPGPPLMNESEYSCELKNGAVPEMPISSVCFNKF
ncbi:hypothetical protein AVEN_102965-1 [Araneus ventricosus]|uniref:Uncharacterized protein n=1 Tax=Araneus ventricosus TaxID=182803 RepID=A0A4Y2B7B5_ARAVE|nr:hypothetical protein AVEN_102965-1 [Araneus ventricosus]